uniref:AAA+ ATPase domain-containing protein n=1 Tax=Cucumis sativus TaxID=3659 RepID=A0A0A0LJV7_CUCSA
MKLLLLDVSDFSLKMQSKYGCPKKESSFRRSISEVTLERMSSVWGSFSILPTSGNTRVYSVLSKYTSSVFLFLINKKKLMAVFKVILIDFLSHGLGIFQEGNSEGKDTLKLETNAESSKEAQRDEAVGAKTESKSENPATEAEKSVPIVKKYVENVPPQKAPFDKKFLPTMNLKRVSDLKLSLQMKLGISHASSSTDLFKSGLLKPCRGILLFGPPGTDKTMLAKAIANEVGASFINVSMSTITSKWFGEDEKNVRALFMLAAKVSPTIIFVDEVDSMLGQRTRVGEHEAMRKIKNEFMSHWDGLLTRNDERILVLAATNRPFDLDEAIIRRFERRIMVGLPLVESRELILRTLLSKEKAEDLDFKELATMTEGYSGSDLKNLCVTAAYRPVRELL